jgi:hypothetical protein
VPPELPRSTRETDGIGRFQRSLRGGSLDTMTSSWRIDGIIARD